MLQLRPGLIPTTTTHKRNQPIRHTVLSTTTKCERNRTYPVAAIAPTRPVYCDRRPVSSMRRDADDVLWPDKHQIHFLEHA